MGHRTTKISVLAGFLAGFLALAAVQFGGIGGCGSNDAGGGGDEGTRSLTGALPVSLPAPLTLHQKRQKSQSTLACTDVQVCCIQYGVTGATPTSIDVGTDCRFSLELPLNSYCACYLASGTDDDGDGCKDTYVGSIGCSANGYSGALPVFADEDGGTGDIDLGTSSIEGKKVVAANDPCAQVDQDGDGTPDSEDSDDDGDGTGDAGDVFEGDSCADLCQMDANENDVPDCYELGDVADAAAALKLKGQGLPGSFFDLFFGDSDGDQTPDGCDANFGCDPSADDADGDCIPDAFNDCDVDDDGDGLPNCYDCDPTDASVTSDCYDFCSIDNDGDGFGLCDDCDDQDPDVTYECFGANYCETDGDADGYGFCIDCDDSDPAVTTDCYGDFCNNDFDGDGVGICEDCDDYDSYNMVTIINDCCTYDGDGDGVGICADCDDYDPLITSTTDTDGDLVDACIDCDDNNSTVTYECYGADYCGWDDDGDGVLNCDDCNPFDPYNDLNYTTGDDCCNFDGDGDTIGICSDCDDFDPTNTSYYCP